MKQCGDTNGLLASFDARVTAPVQTALKCRRLLAPAEFESPGPESCPELGVCGVERRLRWCWAHDRTHYIVTDLLEPEMKTIGINKIGTNRLECRQIL